MAILQIKDQIQYQEIIHEIYTCQFQKDPKMNQEINAASKKKMYEDVEYNVSLLTVSLELGEEKIFENHARWLYQLLCSLMTSLSRERICDQMTAHYTQLGNHLEEFVEESYRPMFWSLIERAIAVTKEECENSSLPNLDKPVKYKEEMQEYLNSLLSADTRKAMFLLPEYIQRGIPLGDVYVDIVGETLNNIGERWHQHLITVDQEHFCTSVAQLSVSQLYPMIFHRERKEKKILVTCVGSELHEAGARMVADLFEYSGWDSIYLGAAVPPESVLSAIELHNPDLVALSVTMPQHLIICKDTVTRIRERYLTLPIAVGGKAFESADKIWKNWRVDVYTQDARDLVQWAEDTLQ